MSLREVKWPLSLNWKQGKDIPTENDIPTSITINGKVYCGGGTETNTIIEYSPDSGDWSGLPTPPVEDGFAMTSFNSQLALVGGPPSDGIRIRVWDSVKRKWDHPYPTLPGSRSYSAAVSHQKYLIVACGSSCGSTFTSKVDVLDSSSSIWYSAQPVPVGGYRMSSVVVNDCWYLSSYGGWHGWENHEEHIFWTCLPTLISTATSDSASSKQIWHELPTPPVPRPTLLALQGHLLLVGREGYVQKIHRYDKDTERWTVCGQLPVGMRAPCCGILPSGDLMVAGGWTGEDRYNMKISKKMWIAKII